MRTGIKLASFVMAGVLCLGGLSAANDSSRHQRKAKKVELPPLPSGPRGPVPQLPLDSTPAVAPQVSYRDGQLTILAPNSTLGDILRAVRKQTGAEMEVPASANERVVTQLGPGLARDVVAELLNGSKFNYVLLGSPNDASVLTRVVLVAKTGGDAAGQNPQPQDQTSGQTGNVVQAPQPDVADAQPDAPDAEAADDNATDENADQSAEADQPAPAPDQPGVKTPQQMLQEMQQRQLQLQQQQPPGQPPIPGGAYPQPPQRPQQEQ
ncbi:MAG: hypothetical protein LAO24_17130 [Acidobacteriia bacterium]|nr:hypothetical protein [Terriglobia bacterium]